MVITTGENSKKKKKYKTELVLECVVVKNAKDSQVEQHLWFGNIPSIFLHRGNCVRVCMKEMCERK